MPKAYEFETQEIINLTLLSRVFKYREVAHPKQILDLYWLNAAAIYSANCTYHS